MSRSFSDAELLAYLDEDLPSEVMAQFETAARDDATLVARLAQISSGRDAGVHSLGEIWRRRRLTCPTREQWGSYLLGLLEPEQAAFYRFHVEVSGCRICQANLADLASDQQQSAPNVAARRQKYFQSSAGHLRHNSHAPSAADKNS